MAPASGDHRPPPFGPRAAVILESEAEPEGTAPPGFRLGLDLQNAELVFDDHADVDPAECTEPVKPEEASRATALFELSRF
jgi:hypothetical protein